MYMLCATWNRLRLSSGGAPGALRATRAAGVLRCADAEPLMNAVLLLGVRVKPIDQKKVVLRSK